jgi:hypothetical protein
MDRMFLSYQDRAMVAKNRFPVTQQPVIHNSRGTELDDRSQRASSRVAAEWKAGGEETARRWARKEPTKAMAGCAMSFRSSQVP